MQCVELDFQYASEGIHRRWDAGFRITACAATPDQVLSDSLLWSRSAVAHSIVYFVGTQQFALGVCEDADALTPLVCMSDFESFTLAGSVRAQRATEAPGR